jgi:adenylate kinase family enzyme
MKIHILGASGSGTTTIGKRLSQLYEIPHFDSDDIYWKQTEIPYTKSQAKAVRRKLLKKIIDTNNSWVISGSATSWGELLLAHSDIIILVSCPTEVRLNRLKKRETERYGSRVELGGDMHKNSQEFLNWASLYDEGGIEVRSKKSQTTWLQQAKCQVFEIENLDLNHCIKSIQVELQSLELE